MDPNVSGLQDLGVSAYQLGTFTATTRIFDLENHHTTFQSLTDTPLNGGSGTIAFTAMGSQKGFGTDTTGPQTAVSALNNSRYVQIIFSLTNTNATTPIQIADWTLTYSPGASPEFNYTASGCGTVGNGSPWSGLLFLLPLILVGFLISKNRKTYHS